MKKSAVLLVVIMLFFSSFKAVINKTTVSDFKLKNAATNKFVSLSDYSKAKGFILIFTCNKCPMAKLYSKTLNNLNSKYKPLNVPLLSINSMDTVVYAEESFRKMQKTAKSERLNFPYLQDKNQIVVKKFKASHTPQAFVIWKNKIGTYDIKYEGAINDNAAEPEKAVNNFVSTAVSELLVGKTVTTIKSESFGCRIFIRGEKQKMD